MVPGVSKDGASQGGSGARPGLTRADAVGRGAGVAGQNL